MTKNIEKALIYALPKDAVWICIFLLLQSTTAGGNSRKFDQLSETTAAYRVQCPHVHMISCSARKQRADHLDLVHEMSRYESASNVIFSIFSHPRRWEASVLR